MGIFNADGVAEFYEIDKKNTAQKYLDLLQNSIIPTLRDRYPQPQKIVILQDRCPIHQAGVVINYLNSLENFEVITTPAKGSDMNPIEHVWAMMARRMDINPTWDIDTFRRETRKAWDWCVNKDNFLHSLAGSMADRFKTVIAYEGRWTKY